MVRALVEFLFVIVLAFVGRLIISSILRGVGQASANAFRQTAAEAERRQRSGQGTEDRTSKAGVLHKDPVCGTYVSDSTSFRGTHKGQAVYFCSAECLKQFDPLTSNFTGARGTRT